MLNPHTLWSLDATQILGLYKNGSVTVVEYAQALLQRVQARDHQVQAWAYFSPDHVLEQARALDRIPREERGPLHGVAVGIKDVIHTGDMPTRFGSPLYKGAQPDFDASLVSILRSAGAIIFGKATTTEFTVAKSGPPTTNPRDPNRTPGGSSAGSAAAVADLQVPLSFGTQNGGSIIRPASYNGIFAMKPSIGAISRDGTKIVSSGLDTCGFFARSLEDLQLIADVYNLRQYDQAHSEAPPEVLRIAFVKTAIWPKAGHSTIAAMAKAAEILTKLGMTVEDVSLPSEFNDAEELKVMHKMVLSGDAEATFLSEYRRDKTLLSQKIRDLVENRSKFMVKDIVQARDQYAALRPIFDKFALSYDAIITPSAIDVAPEGLDDMGDGCFNSLWTGLHAPVIHVPAFIGTDGMPVGLSFVAARGVDQRLLQVTKRLSEALMAEGGWHIIGPTENSIEM